MKHKFSQQQRLQQKMTLTPQMRQSMELLTMSVQQLNEYVDSSLEKNPLLKKEFGFERNGNGDTSPYENKDILQKENPRVSLIAQLRLLDLSDKELEIAEYLIFEIDDNGYIKADLEEAADELRVGYDEVKKVLSSIQSMEPAGIGARDVSECLRLQLKRMRKENSLEYKIAADLMNELAQNDVKKISKVLGADEKKVMQAIENIKKLNPRPASTILSRNEEPVIPDIIVNIKNKKIRLELNREWIPRLRVYNPYKDQLDIIKDPQVKEFLKKNISAAKNLIDGLKRREETMCRVANHILEFQKDRIQNDITQIKGLLIKQIAEALKLHPSTISRAVSNKYIQINDKVIPLKSLLSRSVKMENGESTSLVYVKNRIKEFVNSENKTMPLSDDAIKSKLDVEGIQIKRRTVAKYRESIKILPSHLRKKINLFS